MKPSKKTSNLVEKFICNLMKREAYFTARDVREAAEAKMGDAALSAREINQGLKNIVRQGKFTYDPSTRPFVYVRTNKEVQSAEVNESFKVLISALNTFDVEVYSEDQLKEIRSSTLPVLDKINVKL